MWDEPAFRDQIRAYRNGPVVRTVEQTYRESYPMVWGIDHAIGGSAISPEVMSTVRLVLEHYGTRTANQLEAQTKLDDSPWRAVWGDRPATDSGWDEIPLGAIAAWFGHHGASPRRAPVPPSAPEGFIVLRTLVRGRSVRQRDPTVPVVGYGPSAAASRIARAKPQSLM
jgi:hypothetical protein